MKHNLEAIVAIAARDVTKLARDRTRIIFSFVFPFIFIGILGQSLQSNISGQLGFNILLFTFLGVLAQTFFQSTASGIISLVVDRDNDFAQEMFIAPIPRWVIIAGKIVGESTVSFILTVSILVLGIVLQIPVDWPRLLLMLPAGFLICILGGSFGVLIMANLKEQQSAQQVFPLILFPQFFLAGIFNPIHNLPPVLWFFSRIAPMTYAVDFFRGLYYWGKPEYTKIVLYSPAANLLVITLTIITFLIIGTQIFVNRERNR
jgi:ABC-2 type transport system permease protein